MAGLVVNLIVDVIILQKPDKSKEKLFVIS